MTNKLNPHGRYFGRCSRTGCKHRRVIDQRTEGTKFFAVGGTLTVLDANGLDWPLHEIGNREQIAALRLAGLVCPEHDAPVYFRGGRSTFNPQKVCNAKCMGAAGPACDCSCGGANHGGSHL